MRSADGMVRSLATGTRAVRWGRVALLALALQIWHAWLLLGVWVIVEGGAPISVLARLRMLPAHPDWVLAALVQSAVTATLLVELARHWRAGWALLTASVAGGVGWAVTFAQVPGGLDGSLANASVVAMAVFRSVQAFLTVLWVLSVLALTWRRAARWAAVPLVAIVGGGAAGAIRLGLTYTFWGAPWPEEWPRDLANEVVGVALLAAVFAGLRGTTEPTNDDATVPSAGLISTIGTGGLLTLTAVHLVAGRVHSAWTLADSQRLLVAAALLAVLAAVALAAWLRQPSPAHPRG